MELKAPPTAILALGELVVDWVCMEKGAGMLHTGAFWRCLGGNAANVAIGIRRLGGNARIVAKVGDDLHEKFLRQSLTEEGVDLRFLIVDPKYPTAQCYAFWDREDDYTYFNWPIPHAADMLCADELHSGMFVETAVIHTTGISLMIQPRRSAVLRAIELAKEHDVLFSFDAAFSSGGNHFDEHLLAMKSAHILKLNFYELAYWELSLSNRSLQSCDIAGSNGNQIKQELLAASKKILETFKPALLAVTLGEYGCLLMSDRASCFCPGLKVKTVAAVGAGDGFVGSLLHKLISSLPDFSAARLSELDGNELYELGMFANATGALVTTTAGASDGLPTTPQVLALLADSQPG